MPTTHSRRAAALVALAVTVLCARPAHAQAPAVQSTVEAFLDQVGGAVMQVMRSDESAASADVAAARLLLDELRTLSVDPAVGPAARRFARLVRAMDGAAGRAQATVDDPRIRERRKVRVLKKLYGRGMKALAVLGRVTLAEKLRA